ncbi:MAG: acyl-CoA dehydrogenase domain-containing protein, partial [Pseudomonadota bacterium]
MIDTHEDFKQLRKWQKEGTIAKNLELEGAIAAAAEKNLINETVAERMNQANELRKQAIAVDNFAPGEL